MDISSLFKGISAAIGAFAGYFWGEIDGFMYAIITLVVIDYLTGFICAIIKKKLSSEKGFRGIAKKLFIFVFIGIAHILDVALFGETHVLRTMVIFFYASNEGLSIIENAAYIGLPVPDSLVAALHLLRKKADNLNKDDNKSDESEGNV